MKVEYIKNPKINIVRHICGDQYTKFLDDVLGDFIKMPYKMLNREIQSIDLRFTNVKAIYKEKGFYYTICPKCRTIYIKDII